MCKLARQPVSQICPHLGPSNNTVYFQSVMVLSLNSSSLSHAEYRNDFARNTLILLFFYQLIKNVNYFDKEFRPTGIFLRAFKIGSHRTLKRAIQMILFCLQRHSQRRRLSDCLRSSGRPATARKVWPNTNCHPRNLLLGSPLIERHHRSPDQRCLKDDPHPP